MRFPHERQGARQSGLWLPPGCDRRKAGPRERGLRQGRRTLRPDERPHVGRPAPAVEGRFRRSCCRRPEAAQDFAVLDVAGGTGDIAFRIARAGGSRHAHHRCRYLARNDRRGAKRARRTRASGDNATSPSAMPRRCAFPDKSFDAYTIAFGIRNVTHIDKALARPIAC